jgi:hypothetical protein
MCGSRSVPMDQYLSIATYCVVCVSHGDSRRCGRPFRWWMSMANFLFFQWAQKTHTRPLWHVRKDCIRISVFFFFYWCRRRTKIRAPYFRLVWFCFVFFLSSFSTSPTTCFATPYQKSCPGRPVQPGSLISLLELEWKFSRSLSSSLAPYLLAMEANKSRKKFPSNRQRRAEPWRIDGIRVWVSGLVVGVASSYICMW